MELKFVAATKPGPVSVTIKRRQRLVQRIDHQVAYCTDMQPGTLPRGSWAWIDEIGTYFLPIKYGRLPLELKKGMFSIACTDPAEVAEALKTVRASVLDGSYDEAINKAATAIRAKFAGE